MTTKKKTPTKKAAPTQKVEVTTVTVRATRNFDQMVRGEIEVVDPKVKYWADNIRGGNLEVVK